MKNGGSPLKKVWDGRLDEQDWGVIIINDDVIINEANEVLNMVFSRIRDYEHRSDCYCGNPFQRLEFWKNIRLYVEDKHRVIIREDLRIKLLNSRVYKYACLQEALFSNEIENVFGF